MCRTASSRERIFGYTRWPFVGLIAVLGIPASSSAIPKIIPHPFRPSIRFCSQDATKEDQEDVQSDPDNEVTCHE
ncbi:hypothetical protein KEM48_012854 [Puccinia striiformis f. sp. tritici PST-130]|nr:hypothetical protein KEM48_012854 [Puccinia striiformis f. sp. tritici PST-130]